MAIRLRSREGERGASSVEFAILAMTLVTILAGITQFGVTFFQYLEVVHAAREGARWASLGSPDGSVTTPGTTKWAVYRAAPGLTPRLTDDQITIDPPNPTSSTWGGNPVSVTVDFETPIFTPMMQRVMRASAPSLHLSSTAVQKEE